MSIPFLDLHSMHDPLASDLHEALDDVLDRSNYILGPALSAFEAAFAEYCGTRHCLGVANGLDALHLILRALEIGSGDEVIVPAHTFIATWLAVSHTGATPIPVDVDPATGNLDPKRVEEALTTRTRAVMPVHLYGQPAAMDDLANAVADRNIVLIEDAAQAHGASYRGRRCGNLGIAAGFSFYPGKNLGALGDGGAIVTNDDTVADTVRRLRNYGSSAKYRHESLGWNSRLDELQAAFLQRKLSRLDAWTAARRNAALAYQVGLAGIPDLVLPHVIDDTEPVWHLFVIRTIRRDALSAHLASREIGSLVHYPTPPHLQDAYRHLGYPPGTFPQAEAWSREALSLPMWPGVPTAPVIAAIREFFAA